jgi:glycosyltransferase involved in cell wall biosynthesis
LHNNNIAIIYDRLNPMTLGSVIAMVKGYAGKIYVVDGQDPRISSIARSLGADVIGHAGAGKGFGLNRILVEYFDGAYVFLYGDGSHSPDKIPMLLDQLKDGYDVALGARSKDVQVSESVLYLNNRKPKAGFSGFMACSSKCLDKPFFDSTNKWPVKEIYDNALSRGLKVKQLADEEGAMLGLYRVAVVVPAYNEEALVGQTIESVPPYVNRIYVVDDCSTDHTPDVIKSAGDPRVVHIRHEVNKGVGAAIVTGYKKALEDEMDVVAVMAGDNQMDPEQLPRLLVPVIEGKADYAKGNRLLSRDLRKGMSAWRSLGNFLLTMITKIGSGYWHITDPQNGYTAISRRALESLDLDSVYTYYGYCNDLLIKLNAFGLRTVDVAMPARYGTEKSHIKYSRFIMKVAPMILRGFLWRLKTKYVILDFNPLVLFYAAGMAMIPAASALGAWGLFQKLTGNEVTSNYALLSISIMIWGVLFLLFAMVLDMQDNKSRNMI